MNKESIGSKEKLMEKEISQIGAKVADALEISEKVRELSDKFEALLIDAQKELEELYVSLGESRGLDCAVYGEVKEAGLL